MEKINIKIKKLDNSQDMRLPQYESEGSSGMDIRAAISDSIILQPGEVRLIPTGLAVSIPLGFEAQIRPRSGLALKHGIGLVNSPGTIDSDYRGEIGVIMINWGQNAFTINRGDRIAQMVIAKVCHAEIVPVMDLDCTERGKGGFGHSGVN